MVIADPRDASASKNTFHSLAKFEHGLILASRAFKNIQIQHFVAGYCGKQPEDKLYSDGRQAGDKGKRNKR